LSGGKLSDGDKVISLSLGRHLKVTDGASVSVFRERNRWQSTIT